MQDLETLKKDILLTLTNNKYFIQDEIEKVASDPSMVKRIQVEKLISLFKDLSEVNSGIVMAEQIFKQPEPQAQPSFKNENINPKPPLDDENLNIKEEDENNEDSNIVENQ